MRKRADADNATGPLTQTWVLALGVAVLAVVLAVVFVNPRQWSRGFLINEEMYFAQLARSLADGEGYVTYTVNPFVADEIEGLPVQEFTRPPAYPLFLAGLLKLGLDELAAGIGLSIAWLAITVAGFYVLANRLLGSWRISLFLCGIYLATSTTLFHGSTTAPEMMFDALFLLICLCLLSPTGWRSFAAGVLLRLGMATKMLFAPYLVLVPAYLAWVAVFGHEGSGNSGDSRAGRAWNRAALQRAAKLLASLAVGLIACSIIISMLTSTPAAAQVETLGRYSLNFLMETSDFPRIASPWLTLDPPSAWSYFAEKPDELVKRTARLMSRTPTVINEVGTLPLQGSLGLLLLVVFALAATAGWPQPEAETRRFLWFSVAAFIVTLPAVWAYHVKARYFFQLYPLFLVMIAAQAERLRGSWVRIAPRTRRAVISVAVFVLVAYPTAWTLREGYRNPGAFLSRGMAVHSVDYQVLAEDIREHTPAGAIVVTDFGYELPFLTGNPTIFPPLAPQELRWVLERFDVAVVAIRPAHHPGFSDVLTDFELRVERPGYAIYVR